MEIFCVSNIPVKPYVLESNVDGISLEVSAYTLFGMGTGWNSDTASKIKNELKRIGEYGKRATIAIPFGNESGNILYAFGYLDFTFSHHKGRGNKIPVKIPVFFNEGYIQKVREAITWLATELKKDKTAWEVLENVKVTGCNNTTPEMYANSQDWTGTEDSMTAYRQAEKKWKDVGYTPEKTYNSNMEFIKIFDDNFEDKNLLQCYIPNDNGFPCVDGCLPKQRPHTAEVIMEKGEVFYPNYHGMYTSYNGSPIGEQFTQINRERFGMPLDNSDEAAFAELLDKARAQGIQYLECFDLNLLYFKTIFN